jgi:hypothetical protein
MIFCYFKVAKFVIDNLHVSLEMLRKSLKGGDFLLQVFFLNHLPPSL